MIAMSIVIFAGAFAMATYAVAATILPNLAAIGDALAGRSRAAFPPLSAQVRAERRAAVMRWAATPRVPARPLRAAA